MDNMIPYKAMNYKIFKAIVSSKSDSGSTLHEHCEQIK